MTMKVLDDELWQLIKPILPKHKTPSRKGGRPPISDRAVLKGILFVLKTGIPWEYLPKEMRCGSGMTCWRRLRDWKRQGVWKRLHQLLLDKLQSLGKIDWSRAVIDSASVRAMQRGKKRDPAPWTAVNTGRNTTSSWTPKAACPWPSRSREPTVMTSRN
jgi:transposase